MNLRTNHGYAAALTCLILPIVILSLAVIAFSLMKTRHSLAIKTSCQQQYFNYFSTVKSEIQFIEAFNPSAVGLYHIQMALLPMIWLPPVLKVYRAILKLRQTLEKAQKAAIKMFNIVNTALSVKIFAGIQRALYSENRKLRETLTHQSLATYFVNPKLQIVKRMNILFPPYDPHPQILKKQKFQTIFRNNISPKTWMNVLAINRLNETYTCAASLNLENSQLTITYQL